MRHFAAAATLVLLSVSSVAALAEETPSPTPTPYPAQGAPGEELDAPLPVPSPIDESVYRRRPANAPIEVPRRGFRTAPGGGMLPPLGIGVAIHMVPQEREGDSA